MNECIDLGKAIYVLDLGYLGGIVVGYSRNKWGILCEGDEFLESKGILALFLGAICGGNNRRRENERGDGAGEPHIDKFFGFFLEKSTTLLKKI